MSDATPMSKEEMFQEMPHIWWKNEDGTRMEFRWIDGEWTWKHVGSDGAVLKEGVGAP